MFYVPAVYTQWSALGGMTGRAGHLFIVISFPSFLAFPFIECNFIYWAYKFIIFHLYPKHIRFFHELTILFLSCFYCIYCSIVQLCIVIAYIRLWLRLWTLNIQPGSPATSFRSFPFGFVLYREYRPGAEWMYICILPLSTLIAYY